MSETVERIECPHCFESVDARASVCPHCQKRIKRKRTPAWVLMNVIGIAGLIAIGIGVVVWGLTGGAGVLVAGIVLLLAGVIGAQVV